VAEESQNRYQSLRRLMDLDKALYQKRLTIAEAGEAVGASARTVGRDMEALSDAGAHIRTDGYSWWSERVAFVANLGIDE
jgi:predicted DNA-binding transcriptional regulator YafY